MDRSLHTAIILLLFISTINFSQSIPQSINYQGLLKDASGIDVPNGDYTLTFKIYDIESGGTELWSETKSLNVVDGIVNTQIGSSTPLTLSFDYPYWLGITVASGSELTPRIKLTSVPYSFMTMNVMDGSISSAKLQDGSVTLSKISDNSVNSSKIIDGSINSIDIGSNQIIKSVNGIKDSVNLIAGDNVTITPNGNKITIGAVVGSGGSGTVTQVNTGDGLTGGPVTTTGTISIAPSGVTSTMILDGTITSADILDGTIATGDLSDNSVTSAKIVDGTVTSTDILDLTVGTTDLANNSVTTGKIVDATITGTDIANSTIGPEKLNFTAGTGTVTNVATGSGLTGGPVTTTGTISIAPSGVTSTMILDGTLLTGDLSDNSITSAKIVDGTVTSTDILDLTVGTTDLANNSVTTGKIVDATITGTDIANSTIGPEKLNFTAGTGTVTNIATGSGLTGGPVTTTGTISIAPSGVTSTMILDGTITNIDIANATITTSKLNFTPGTVTQINTGSGLTGGPITSSGTISIPNGGITSSMILDGTVTSTDILDATILSNDIANSQVVKSLNNLRDNITLVAGTNISITPSGNNLTINSTAGGVGGSGTINYLPKFSATNTIGNSLIFDNGTNIGIGTVSPQQKFDVVGGDARINGLTLGRGNGNVITNTVLGYLAMQTNASGYENTAIGQYAMYSNTSGIRNTALGDYSLYGNTSGHENIAIGTVSMRNNTEGFYNTSVGWASLLNNTVGWMNTAIGTEAQRNNIGGHWNVSLGFAALYTNSEGNGNTAIGNQSLYDNSGSYNTAIGSNSGGPRTDLSYATFVGSDSYASVDGLTNVSGFGYNSRPTASNQVRIGNSSVSSIGGSVQWTTFSDGRFKTAIQEDVKGLDFIMKLRPVTYQLNINKLAADLKEDEKRDEKGNIISSPSEIDLKARNEKSQKVYTGFIAQEVEKVAKDLGYDFSGVDSPKNQDDFYGLRYAEFVVPLVKAVQEQQATIQNQQKVIDDLVRRIEALEKR